MYGIRSCCSCHFPAKVGKGTMYYIINWDEPERVPHIRKVCEFCLSVCTALYSDVQQTHSDKQHEQTSSYTKKHRLLMNINFT